MAANNALVSMTASLLPDEMKTQINGTIEYNINDTGNSNKWVFQKCTVTNASADLFPNGIQYITILGTGDSIVTTTEASDDIVFLALKHTGTTNGTDTTTANLKINLNNENASSSGLGNILIKPNEMWASRLDYSAISSVNAYSSSGSIMVAAYAVVEDGGI
jgi:hypothetical protein